MFNEKTIYVRLLSTARNILVNLSMYLNVFFVCVCVCCCLLYTLTTNNSQQHLHVPFWKYGESLLKITWYFLKTAKLELYSTTQNETGEKKIL